MTVKDAAIQLGVNPKTVRRWIQSGKLQAEKVATGNVIEWMISEEEVEKFKPVSETDHAPVVQPIAAQEQFFTLLESTLTVLKEQLERKDLQIMQLQKQIDELLQSSKISALPARKAPLWKALWTRRAYMD